MAALVEKLVNLVGQAFYTDEHVVVLRALMREKFLKDDDMGNAVNLQAKQVRKIMNELHHDYLVSEEVLNDKKSGGSSSTSYWYIDYKYFVDVVRFRLYLMDEHLKESEGLEIERQTFRCKDPDCGREYTALEAQRLLVPGQYEFRCGHCNQPLMECDNNERLEHVQSLQRKFKDQMNGIADMHDSLYEILRRIGDVLKEGHTLPNNLPSENRAAGVGGNSSRSKGNGAGGGGGNANRAASFGNGPSYLYPTGDQGQEIVVDIADTTKNDHDYLSAPTTKTETTNSEDLSKAALLDIPEFLRGSKISGHMAAKHVEASPSDDVTMTNASDAAMSIENDSSMTEEEKQEAFRKVYLEEVARYNAERSRGGNGMGDTEDGTDEEEMEGVEWEYYDWEDIKLPDIEVRVGGKPKRLHNLTDEDLEKMTDDEFVKCYQLCRPGSVLPSK